MNSSTRTPLKSTKGTQYSFKPIQIAVNAFLEIQEKPFHLETRITSRNNSPARVVASKCATSKGESFANLFQLGK